MSRCLHPIMVRGTLLPCGKCPNCTQNKRQSVSNRLLLESAFCGGPTYFVTLSIDDDHMMYALPPNEHDGIWSYCFDKDELQRFIKRLRKHFSFKYLLVCEHGDTTGRSHYHGLFFFSKPTDIGRFTLAVQNNWHNGYCTVSRANDNRFAYIVKYCLKEDISNYDVKHFNYTKLSNDSLYNNEVINICDHEYLDYRRPFRLWSSRPGLGASAIPWLNEYIFNDGQIRSRLEINGKTLTFDRYILDHIDPSLREEVKKMTYFDNFEDIQSDLMRSRLSHSRFDQFGRHDDFTEDDKIMKRRRQSRMLKKTHSL